MSKDNDPEETEYEVDKILKVRINPKNNKREFLVKWQRIKDHFRNIITTRRFGNFKGLYHIILVLMI